MFRAVELPSIIQGKLFFHSMPGRYEEWEDFEGELEEKQIDAVACLVSMEEIEDKSPSYAQALRDGDGSVSWTGYAIPDFGIPDYPSAYLGLVRTLAKQVSAGEKVLLHCAGGVGRTGMTGILLLRYLGMPTQEAESAVSDAGSGPETDAQRELTIQEILTDYHQHAMQRLIELGFEKVGHWCLNEGNLEFHINEVGDESNVLYCFELDHTPLYIGKTSQTLRARLNGYTNPGNTQITNIRVNNYLTETLEADDEHPGINIYAFKDPGQLSWGGFHLNLAAGLEDDLIRQVQPELNVAGVGAPLPAPEAPVPEGNHNYPQNFFITLGVTYYNHGDICFNPPEDVNHLFGDHDEALTISFPNGENITCRISRTDGNNNRARIHELAGQNSWSTQVQNDYDDGDTIECILLSRLEMEVIGLVPD